MNKLDAAKIISGLTDFETEQSPAPTNVHIITGEVGSTSEDGKVMVSLDGLVFSDDNDQFVEFDTLGGLEEGDTATILLTGENGRAMVPLAIGGVGTVDRIVERVGSLYADYAEIGELVAEKASITDLEAATARIGDLEADHVSVSDFQAEQANIDTLQANTADIATIRANSAKVQNLTAAQLEADHATIGTLDTTYMHANMSNSDVAWIENGTIKNGAIVSAMINDVSANKLTAGTINGSVINVTNLNADNITTGTINGQRIGEGSLSLSKLEDDVYTESEVNNIVDGLNDRIDGAIETHTGTAVPTLNNSPASSWNTTKLRDEHVGDVYYVVNSQSQQNGYCYRFTKSGSTYSWQLIKDSDVTAALSRLTTAEGKITTFDSDISTLKTDTGTLTTRTTNLETRMSDAEDDILDKVDTTTFNEVSDTVDAHTQTISQHTTAIANKADSSTVTAVTNRVTKNEQDISGINTSIGQLQTTVESKADGSTVSTISNKLNTVSDTVDGHTQSITSLQNTVSQKADGSTVSTLQSDYATFKQQTEQFESTVGTTYATKTELNDATDDITELEGRVSTNETSISNNSSAIALKANSSDVYTKTAVDGKINQEVTDRNAAITAKANEINLSVTEKVYQGAQPNLSPFFESVPFGTTNSSYWLNDITTSAFTALDGGWAHFNRDNSSGTSLSANLLRMVASPSVIDGEVYTCLVEIRNIVANTATSKSLYTQQTTGAQFWGNGGTGGYMDGYDGFQINNSSLQEKSYYMPMKARAVSEHESSGTRLIDFNWQVPAGAQIECDIRVSLYPGEYSGPYKPYSGAQLYASQAELKVTNDSISTKVDKNGVISSINQSAESVTIDASKINLVGAVTIGDLASATQDAVLNSNLQVGGRNLLTGTGDWSGAHYSDGTVNGDVFDFGSHAEQSWYWCQISHPHMPFANVDGKTLTLSFDYRSDDFSDTTGEHYIYINAAASATEDGSRSKYRQISTSAFDGVYVPTTEWQRGSITFDLSESFFNAGSGECNYFFIQFYNHTLNSYQLRHVQLEAGNVATDWTPAPEDQKAYADEVYAQKSDVTWTGTCATAAGTAAKEVVCDGFTASELVTGATICVRFNAANTSTGALTLNVNGTGAKTVSVASGSTSSTNQLLWASGATIRFMYNASLGQWRVADTTPTYYSTCSIAEGVAAKTAGCAGCVIFKGVAIHIVMTAANTNTSATLNVNSTGAKAIYYGNTTTRPTTANEYGWKAGATASFVFDGAYWRYADASAMYQSADAAKTATNYIVADSSGIKIADANPASSTTYQHQTSSGTDFVVNGGVRNRVDSTGMTLYDGSGTSDENIVAKFTEALIEIGKNSTSTVIKFCGGVASLTYTTANKFFNITALRAALRGVSEYGNSETANAQVAAQFDASSDGDTNTAILLQTATSSAASSNMQATASGSPSASVELGSGNGTSTIDMWADYGLKLNNGPYIRGINFGYSASVTNQNGIVTFNPGMGVKPTVVFVTHALASNETNDVAKLAVPFVWAIDSATQVQVRWKRTDSNDYLRNNAVGYYWLAIY